MDVLARPCLPRCPGLAGPQASATPGVGCYFNSSGAGLASLECVTLSFTLNTRVSVSATPSLSQAATSLSQC